jgi:hypothetical protein
MPTYRGLTIISATYQENGSVKVNFAIGDDGRERWISIREGQDGWDYLQEWVADGNSIDPYVPPVPLTNEELIDMAGEVMTAFLKAYANREGLTLQQIRDAILAEM